MSDNKFDLKVNDDGYIFDEKGNTVLTIREESWHGRDYKLFLRKCYVDSDGNLTPNKGFSFLTENGPNRLTEELVRMGFGETSELVKILKERNDIIPEELDGIKVQEQEYYDPKDIFAIGVGIND